MYKKLMNGSVMRLSDGACIPNNPQNRDWRKYQQWLSEGGIPEPEQTEEEKEQQRQKEIKFLEQNVIQVQLQLSVAQIENLEIAAELEDQLNGLRSQLSKAKKSI